MKWRFILIPILVMSLVGICYGEDVTVELLPKNIEADLGYTFNLSLVVKNVPEEDKCAGFEAKICYDPNILNLTGIYTGNIGKNALKNIDLSSGYISLVWLSESSYGNFTLATLSFKALKLEETEVSLEDVVISSEKGYKYKNILVHPATVAVVNPRPNLNIKEISIGTPLYRINTPINVTITNDGYVDFNESFSVNLYADTKEIGSITVNGLKVGESKTLTFNWTPEKVKNYTLVAIIIPKDTVPERNKNDNKIVEIVEVTEKSIGIGVFPSVLTTNYKTTFTVDISLFDIDYRRPVKGIEGVLTYDSQLLNCTNFTFLVNATGGCKEVIFRDGKVIFRIIDGEISKSGPIAKATFKAIDVDNLEINLERVNISDSEGYLFNNVTISPANVTITGPNLNIKEVSIGTPLYRINTPINVTITNDGYVDFNESFSVNLYADTKEIGSITLNGLKVGESKTLTFNWTPEKVKKYTLVVSVDPENKVPENNENDNKIVRNVEVQQLSDIHVKVYKILQNNDTLKVMIDVLNVPKERPVGGYDIYIKLENLSVTEVTSTAGICIYDLSDNTLFITGFNISKSGKFSVVNVTFNITGTTYSMRLHKVILSDTDGYPFQRVIIENVSVARDIKSEKIKNFLSRSKLIVGSEIDISLSAKYLKTEIDLINRSLDVDKSCVLVGGPVANPTVKKYSEVFPVNVTNDYPGRYRGVIEKVVINNYTVVLLAGSDRWGTKAAVEYFKTLEDLPDEPIFVEWRDGKAVKIEKP